MTLLIQDEDVQNLLSVKDCIDDMEEAFRAYAEGTAINLPRIRMETPISKKDMCYYVNTHIGAIPKFETACIRIANQIRPVRSAGADRVRPIKIYGHEQPTEYSPRDWGLILLYSLQTGEPLAIIQGFTLSGIRVAATTALAAKYLARDDSETLGILGTGKMARRHVEAISKVLAIKQVKVYSPSEAHRKEFAEEMSHSSGLSIEPEKDAKRVVKGSDIVCSATNSLKPVIFGEWLTPGQLVTTIVNSDILGIKTEADEAVFLRSDKIVINDKTSVFANRQTELLEPIESGLFGWDKVPELGKIVTGETAGRNSADEIIYFKNNTGMAIQFAAAGNTIYQAALKQKGLCKEFPTELFGTDLTEWYRKGFRPSN
jgi:alanine dehydrogenase